MFNFPTVSTAIFPLHITAFSNSGQRSRHPSFKLGGKMRLKTGGSWHNKIMVGRRLAIKQVKLDVDRKTGVRQVVTRPYTLSHRHKKGGQP